MGIKDDIDKSLNSIFTTPWDSRDGITVPDSEDVKIRDGAVLLDATYLYADMAKSTTLAQQVSAKGAARVLRAYLDMATRVIRWKGGHIRSFDGDRVMAIFVGDAKNTSAVRAAMGINYYVCKDLPARISAAVPKTDEIDWTIDHGVGIDSGKALIVRAGIRGNNDLISIGQAPNVAAKLSDRRVANCPIHVTQEVYSRTRDEVKFHPDGRKRLVAAGAANYGGRTISLYKSSWWWTPWS